MGRTPNSIKQISNETFTKVNYPDNPELNKTKEMLHKTYNQIQHLSKYNPLTTDEKIIISNNIILIMERIGELSQPIFNRIGEIEISHFKLNLDPTAARKSFLQEYTTLHKPYDRIKTIAWTMYYNINGWNEEED
jgi:hypothetical protein